jgi:DNA modification methylase
MTIRMLAGDCRDVLPKLPTDSFDCIVTSPPYWGLRNYGVDGQIGLEPTLDAYVEAMVGVGRELKRVLKPEGTFWLNLGDSYAANGAKSNNNGTGKSGLMNDGRDEASRQTSLTKTKTIGISMPPMVSGLKPKDLCGVPWRSAFSLQADGWWLRSAIVWAKPNPMPESVTDRPTSAYEMVFLLTKSATYFYDAGAIAEVATRAGDLPGGQGGFQPEGWGHYKAGLVANGKKPVADTRNARNVWTIATQPFQGSHFATMPPDLAERCIKAGCPIGGRVLDPFGGAGTTGLVADRLQRHATLIDLSSAYGEMAALRIMDDAPLFAEVVS